LGALALASLLDDRRKRIGILLLRILDNLAQGSVDDGKFLQYCVTHVEGEQRGEYQVHHTDHLLSGCLVFTRHGCSLIFLNAIKNYSDSSRPAVVTLPAALRNPSWL